MLLAVAGFGFTHLCGYRRRVQPSQCNHNVGYLARHPLFTCTHRYVENALLLVPIPVFVEAVITGTRLPPATPTSTCMFDGGDAPGEQELVESVNAMCVDTMRFGVESMNGKSAPPGRSARLAFSTTNLVLDQLVAIEAGPSSSWAKAGKTVAVVSHTKHYS